jgi:hypothetical protein
MWTALFINVAIVAGCFVVAIYMQRDCKLFKIAAALPCNERGTHCPPSRVGSSRWSGARDHSASGA